MRRGSAFAVLISAFFLYLFVFDPEPSAWLHGELGFVEAWFVSRVDWAEVGRLLMDLRFPPLLGALGFLLVSLVLRAWRWRVIARPLDLVPLIRMFNLTNLGYMANNLLPMRFGEVLRAGALSARSRISMAGSVATIVLERVLDMTGALGVLLLMLLFKPLEFLETTSDHTAGMSALARFGDMAPLLGVITAIGLSLLLALVIWRQRSLVVMESLLRRFLPAKPAARLQTIFDSFSAGLAILRSPGEALLLLSQTALINGCYLGSLGFMMHAFSLESTPGIYMQSPFSALLLLLVFVSLGYMIPAAPGAFGTVQYFTALAMGLLGAQPEQSLSFALGNHLITWLVLTGLGLLALPFLGLHFADLINWKEERK